jgi:hypothetical protein
MSWWYRSALLLLAVFALGACSRARVSPYHGVASKMNFERQIINPKAPTDERIPEEVPGEIAQSIYKRYFDSYKLSIPEKHLRGIDVFEE